MSQQTTVKLVAEPGEVFRASGTFVQMTPRPITRGPHVAKGRAARKRRRPSLRDLNAAISADRAALMAKAKANTQRLTGKPTF